MTIDLLPSVAKLAGGELPSHAIDGCDIWPLLASERGAKSPHEALWFYWGQELHAIRSGPWKLHFAHPYVKPVPPGAGGKPGVMTKPQIELSLFHLGKDLREVRNVADRNPDIVARLKALADKARAELGDAFTKQKGSGVREAGKVSDP
jgi:arylsulfatase A